MEEKQKDEKRNHHWFSEEEREGVFTILEAKALVEQIGLAEAAKKVRIITTGTFEPFEAVNLRFRIPDIIPKVKFSVLSLNEIPAYPTGMDGEGRLNGSLVHPEDSGSTGTKIIEELVGEKKVRFKAVGHPSDEYPGKSADILIDRRGMTIAELEILLEKELKPRGYWNTSKKTMVSELGILLPEGGSLSYSGSGNMSPWTYMEQFDVNSCHIYVGGALGNLRKSEQGWILTADLKAVKKDLIRAGAFGKQGGILYIGIGIAYRVDGEKSLRRYMITNEKLMVHIEDMGVETAKEEKGYCLSYNALEQGSVVIDGKKVRTASTASIKKSIEIMEQLKVRIQKGEVTVCQKQGSH